MRPCDHRGRGTWRWGHLKAGPIPGLRVGPGFQEVAPSQPSPARASPKRTQAGASPNTNNAWCSLSEACAHPLPRVESEYARAARWRWYPAAQQCPQTACPSGLKQDGEKVIRQTFLGKCGGRLDGEWDAKFPRLRAILPSFASWLVSKGTHRMRLPLVRRRTRMRVKRSVSFWPRDRVANQMKSSACAAAQISAI